MMNRFFLAITVFVLAGCNTPSYKEPTDGARARVRFAVAHSGEVSTGAILRAYDDGNCTQNETEWMRLRNGAVMNHSNRRLGLPLWSYHENAAKEVYVEANKPMHGMFFGNLSRGSVVYSCGAPFSFTFSENKDYEVRYDMNTSTCSVTIAQFVPAGSGWSLKDVGRFSNQINYSNRGCLDQFKKQRLY